MCVSCSFHENKTECGIFKCYAVYAKRRNPFSALRQVCIYTGFNASERSGEPHAMPPRSCRVAQTFILFCIKPTRLRFLAIRFVFQVQAIAHWQINICLAVKFVCRPQQLSENSIEFCMNIEKNIIELIQEPTVLNKRIFKFYLPTLSKKERALEELESSYCRPTRSSGNRFSVLIETFMKIAPPQPIKGSMELRPNFCRAFAHASR